MDLFLTQCHHECLLSLPVNNIKNFSYLQARAEGSVDALCFCSPGLQCFRGTPGKCVLKGV